MSKFIIVSFFILSLSACSDEPLTQSECKQALLKSAQIFADYNPRNIKFKADLDRKFKMTDAEFSKSMGEELALCRNNWDQSDYRCIMEANKLSDIKNCGLAFN